MWLKSNTLWDFKIPMENHLFHIVYIYMRTYSKSNFWYWYTNYNVINGIYFIDKRNFWCYIIYQLQILESSIYTNYHVIWDIFLMLSYEHHSRIIEMLNSSLFPSRISSWYSFPIWIPISIPYKMYFLPCHFPHKSHFPHRFPYQFPCKSHFFL